MKTPFEVIAEIAKAEKEIKAGHKTKGLKILNKVLGHLKPGIVTDKLVMKVLPTLTKLFQSLPQTDRAELMRSFVKEHPQDAVAELKKQMDEDPELYEYVKQKMREKGYDV